MLKTERLKAGKSQAQLAKESGVHWRTIQELEKNMKAKRWWKNIIALSKALDCSLDSLLLPDDE